MLQNYLYNGVFIKPYLSHIPNILYLQKKAWDNGGTLGKKVLPNRHYQLIRYTLNTYIYHVHMYDLGQ